VEQAPTIDDLQRHPFGRWVVAGSAVVWCAAPDLCGCVCWGTPTPADVGLLLDAFAGFRHPGFAARFDAVLDCRRVEAVPPASLEVLVGWLSTNRDELARRVSLQVGIIPAGIVGFTMSGILPTLGTTHRYQITRDPAEAFRQVAPHNGEALLERLDAIVDRVSGTPGWLLSLRRELRARPVDSDLDGVARRLALSPRTLQRMLQQHATSFQGELGLARFERARDAIAQSDAKIATVAREVGLSERGLEQLVRKHAGCSPAELRDRTPRS
jgi:AraC-like DNA-binding protein